MEKLGNELYDVDALVEQNRILKEINSNNTKMIENQGEVIDTYKEMIVCMSSQIDAYRALIDDIRKEVENANT